MSEIRSLAMQGLLPAAEVPDDARANDQVSGRWKRADGSTPRSRFEHADEHMRSHVFLTGYRKAHLGAYFHLLLAVDAPLLRI